MALRCVTQFWKLIQTPNGLHYKSFKSVLFQNFSTNVTITFSFMILQLVTQPNRFVFLTYQTISIAESNYISQVLNRLIDRFCIFSPANHPQLFIGNAIIKILSPLRKMNVVYATQILYTYKTTSSRPESGDKKNKYISEQQKQRRHQFSELGQVSVLLPQLESVCVEGTLLLHTTRLIRSPREHTLRCSACVYNFLWLNHKICKNTKPENKCTTTKVFRCPKRRKLGQSLGLAAPKKKEKPKTRRQKQSSSSHFSELRVILRLPSCLTRRMRNVSNFLETMLPTPDYRI